MNAGAVPQQSDLVEMAYAAIDDARQWQTLAVTLAQRFEANQAAVLIADRWSRAAPITAWARPEDGAAYVDSYRQMDPFLDSVLVEQMSREPRAWLSQQLIGDAELRASAFYAEYLRPRGNLFWGCGGNYLLGDGLQLQFGVLRDKALGPYEEAERHSLDEIVRHVQRAARLALRLASLRHEAAHHSAVQDQLLDAVLVLDGSGRIIQSNTRARALLNGAGVEANFTPRALRLGSAAEQSRLADAVALARRAGGEPAQSLRLRRQKPLPPLYVVVVPASHASDGAVQLFLRDPRWQPHLPDHALCELFQLTQAQARVCAALTRGEPTDRIALELGVAVNTVRSHIKLAMERIGVNRQSDLVRHLGAALPALNAAGACG